MQHISKIHNTNKRLIMEKKREYHALLGRVGVSISIFPEILKYVL